MFKLRTRFLAALIISLSTVSIALANAPVDIAVKALSQKLKGDLSVSNINLKLDKVERQSISKSKVLIRGEGAANELPIKFDVTVDVAKQMPTDVNYSFVDAASPLAAANSEDILTRDLLDQLSRDYKTTNIVVSIDGFDTAAADGKKNFKGTGDVRIGFDLSRISFDVTMDAKTNTPTEVKYEVQK